MSAGSGCARTAGRRGGADRSWRAAARATHRTTSGAGPHRAGGKSVRRAGCRGPRGPARRGGPGRTRPPRPRRGGRSGAASSPPRHPARRPARGSAPGERPAPGPGPGRGADSGRDRRTGHAAAPARRRHRRGQDGDLRRGHRRRPSTPDAARWSSSRRLPWRCRWSIACERTSTRGSRSSTQVSATESAPTSGGGSGPGVGHRRRDPAGAPRAAGGCRGRSSSTRSTTRPTRATGRLAFRRVMVRSGSPNSRARRSSWARRRRPWTAWVGRAWRQYDRVVLADRPVGAPPTVEVVDLREELAAGHTGLLSRALGAALGSAGHGAPASRRSSC